MQQKSLTADLDELINIPTPVMMTVPEESINSVKTNGSFHEDLSIEVAFANYDSSGKILNNKIIKLLSDNDVETISDLAMLSKDDFFNSLKFYGPVKSESPVTIGMWNRICKFLNASSIPSIQQSKSNVSKNASITQPKTFRGPRNVGNAVGRLQYVWENRHLGNTQISRGLGVSRTTITQYKRLLDELFLIKDSNEKAMWEYMNDCTNSTLKNLQIEVHEAFSLLPLDIQKTIGNSFPPIALSKASDAPIFEAPSVTGKNKSSEIKTKSRNKRQKVSMDS